jgi:hypothetical protein
LGVDDGGCDGADEYVEDADGAPVTVRVVIRPPIASTPRTHMKSV